MYSIPPQGGTQTFMLLVNTTVLEGERSGGGGIRKVILSFCSTKFQIKMLTLKNLVKKGGRDQTLKNLDIIAAQYMRIAASTYYLTK